MTYKINSITLDPQPTTGKWLPREVLGYTGEGRAILPGHRSYEMTWQVSTPSGMHAVVSAWEDLGVTGTATVDLPVLGRAPYAFQTFSGVFVNEPEMDYFFEGHYTNVVLRVDRIQVVSP